MSSISLQYSLIAVVVFATSREKSGKIREDLVQSCAKLARFHGESRKMDERIANGYAEIKESLAAIDESLAAMDKCLAIMDKSLVAMDESSARMGDALCSSGAEPSPSKSTSGDVV